MNVGIFSTQIGTRGTGPEVFDRNSLTFLSQLDRDNQYQVYCVSNEGPATLSLGPNFRVHALNPPGKFAAVAFAVYSELRRRPVDLLHATFVAPLFTPCPFVYTVSCWSQFDRPDFYPPSLRWRIRFLMARSIRNAAGIVCYTEYLRNKVIEEFGVAREKTFVSAPGVSDCFPIEDKNSVRERLLLENIDGPFILFVGSLTDRKNPRRLIQAFARVRERQKVPHKLVMVGDKAWVGDELEKLIGDLNLQGQVLFRPSRPHEDLVWLYNGADAFIFPTLYEGFGLPPLEAMACGTPVVASNVTSVPEVVGDAAYMVDPFSVEDMADGIQRVLCDPALRSELRKEGFRRASQFTWEKTASALLEAYQTTFRSLN